MKKTSFQETINHYHLNLKRKAVTTLQINLGKLCNQACLHCHVDAGPNRTENMDEKTVNRIITLMTQSPSLETVDLTGGAPELNPSFRTLVSTAVKQGLQVIDRCNLTVLYEAGQEDTAEFMAEHQVQIVSSLPCYSRENVEKQRGKGVFGKSIEALLKLNSLGYGKPNSGLQLDLVYNPIGPSLPPAQHQLERDYKRILQQDFGITFNTLFTITNMPIHRFARYLERENRLEEYMELLRSNFNPIAADGIMCRDLVSISWDGYLYDCDFNQMLELPAGHSARSVWDIDTFSDMIHQPIVFEDHCFGCTAGAGSSCTGVLDKQIKQQQTFEPLATDLQV
ncbi:MAG: arsenosugar biosynthesis radical SAM (seleno)protein ArsS [Fidelibacterota bacterium]